MHNPIPNIQILLSNHSTHYIELYWRHVPEGRWKFLCYIHIYIYMYIYIYIFHIENVIIPLNFHIFQRCGYTTNQWVCFMICQRFSSITAEWIGNILFFGGGSCELMTGKSTNRVDDLLDADHWCFDTPVSLSDGFVHVKVQDCSLALLLLLDR